MTAHDLITAHTFARRTRRLDSWTRWLVVWGFIGLCVVDGSPTNP